ncbi:MAG: hypothetical protein QNJ41_23500 [Xenococcaceae cyanobacterium MO_188.B32]|nr:hypothetical protein [Xenococcaceae cyanobacterium MO_188.B32]
MPKRKKLDTNRLKKSRGLGAAPPSLPTAGRGGKVRTDFNIDWNRSTVIFYTAIITIPYLAAVIVSILIGYTVITGILIFVAMLVGLVYFVVRKIDQDGDF